MYVLLPVIFPSIALVDINIAMILLVNIMTNRRIFDYHMSIHPGSKGGLLTVHMSIHPGINIL